MPNYKLKSKLFFLAILLCTLFGLGAKANAATYYVAKTGNDSNPGTEASPWLTIQKAANTVAAGDTVNVNAGTYTESVTISNSGNSNSLIYFKTIGQVNVRTFTLSGNYIKLEGFYVTATDNSWNGTIQINGTGNIIEACHVVNSSRQGIRFGASSSLGAINNCTITNVSLSGIFVDGQNHIVTNNDISRTKVNSFLTGDANGMNIESASGSSLCSGHLVRGNYIHDILFSDSLGYFPHIDAVQSNYFGAICSDVIFEKNHIYLWEEAIDTITTTCGLMLSGANNWTIRNNIIESYSGMNTGTSGTPQQVKLYNNTFRSNPDWTGHYYGAAINLNGGSNHEILNNIIVNYYYADRGAHAIVLQGEATLAAAGNNLFWNQDGSTVTTFGYGTYSGDLHDINPKFVANYTNLHLQSTSPAINAGRTISSIVNDYDGISRPQGASYDIGAYEYWAADTTPPSAPSGLGVE